MQPRPFCLVSRSDSCRWKRGEGLSRSHLRAVPAIPCEPQISGFLCVHCRQRGHSSFQRVVSLREGCSTSQSLGLAPIPAPGSLPSSALCNTAPQLGPRHVGGLWWSREWNPSPSPPQEPEPSPEAPQDIHSSSTAHPNPPEVSWLHISPCLPIPTKWGWKYSFGDC